MAKIVWAMTSVWGLWTSPTDFWSKCATEEKGPQLTDFHTLS